MKFQDLISNISDWIWCEIVDPHLVPVYEKGEFTGVVKQEWDFYVLYWTLQFPLDLIYHFYWRIFIRGKCALRGCQIVYFRNDNLPDDCREWMCERCGSEGINFQVNTLIEPFYEGNLNNFIQTLKGK